MVLVLVGLPARGKSFLSGAVLRRGLGLAAEAVSSGSARHLKLLGVRVRSFNAGELRRDTGKAGIQARAGLLSSL